MRKKLFVVLLAVLAFSAFAVTVSADTITLTQYSDVVQDVTDALGQNIPTILSAVVGVGAGLLLMRVGWNVLRRFVR